VKHRPGFQFPAVASRPLRESPASFQAALLVTPEVGMNSFDHPRVSRVEQMVSELRKLSQAELRQIRGWLDAD